MAFATIDMTKGITGTIPVANGGTGLASGTTGQFLKFTGSTAIGTGEAGGGKVLQVKSSILSSSVYTTSQTSTGIINISITPSATSSYILAMADCNYQTYGNDNTSNPYGNMEIRQGGASGTLKTSKRMYWVAVTGATNQNHDENGSVQAYWTPNTTSAITVDLCLVNGKSTGRVGLFGNADYTNATRLTVFEIGA